MTHFCKLRAPFLLKWVSLNFAESYHRSSKFSLWAAGSYHNAQNPRCYGTKKSLKPEKGHDSDETSTVVSSSARKEAQAALLEYLHSTRSLPFMDAEHISRHSPHFLDNLLKRVENDEEIGHSITRFLRYHPINEYEPFFESMGLTASEYSSLLPRSLMFLNDDEMLMENYHVLCNYGIARDKVGKIYKETTEVFGYDYGVLDKKLKSLEEVGLNQSLVAKVVASSPHVLVGNSKEDFLKALERLKSASIEYTWLKEHLSETCSYNWRRILELLCLFGRVGFREEKLGKLISRHPGLIFESSGCITFSLIGFLVKFGSTVDQINSMLLQFPKLEVGKFFSNLRQCFHFLIEAEMEVQEIGKIVCSNTVLLGTCSLKKLNSLLSNLNTGKKRLCELIKENPQVLRSWVLGVRVKPLPNTGEEQRSHIMKTKFLFNLGFVENSVEMKEAQKLFRGKGLELQERFDCLVNAGLNREDISEMLKVAPQILNQSKNLIEMKIDYLVNGLGYPVSSLVAFPAYLSYTVQRVKLRFTMYNWLKDQELVDPNLALSTILACTENVYLRQYVSLHPKGPEFWGDLKRQIYSD